MFIVNNLKKFASDNLKKLATDESGATAIEYGLIAAGIAVVIIGTVNTLGSKLNTTFTTISNKLG